MVAEPVLHAPMDLWRRERLIERATLEPGEQHVTRHLKEHKHAWIGIVLPPLKTALFAFNPKRAGPMVRNQKGQIPGCQTKVMTFDLLWCTPASDELRHRKRVSADGDCSELDAHPVEVGYWTGVATGDDSAGVGCICLWGVESVCNVAIALIADDVRRPEILRRPVEVVRALLRLWARR